MTALPAFINQPLHDALRGDTAARFLATVEPGGQPNLVPALSAQLDDQGLIRFAAIVPAQTKKNLLHDPNSALIVIDQALQWWTLPVRFSGFTDGEPEEKVKQWGWLEPVEVSAAGKHGRLRLALEFGWTRQLGIPKKDNYLDTLPTEIARQLATLKAVKAIAFLNEQGTIQALPCMSLMPAGPGALVCGTKAVPALRLIPDEAPVAVCLLTFAPNAYQIIGRFEGIGGGLLITNATIRVSGTAPALA